MLLGMVEPGSRRWDTDERGRGVADARPNVPAIQQLAELAGTSNWVAEDPEAHLLPGLRSRTEGTALTITEAEVEPNGVLSVRLAAATRQTRRELRQEVWAMLGGVAELSTHVRETQVGESIRFEVVTGIPPGDGPFATHGHALRIEVDQGAE